MHKYQEQKSLMEQGSKIIKRCNNCDVEKDISEYRYVKSRDNHRTFCKECEYKKGKLYRLENKELFKKRYKENNFKRKEYFKTYQQENKETRKEYVENNREKFNKANKKYYYKNIEKIKKYRKENAERHSKYCIVWNKKRKEESELYKLKCALRSRISKIFKVSKWNKISKTEDLLCCDYQTAFNHLENQFIDGMNWSNHGKWHIDHIIPLSSAKTKSELKDLCNYKNLQPLWAIDNLIKGSKI